MRIFSFNNIFLLFLTLVCNGYNSILRSHTSRPLSLTTSRPRQWIIDYDQSNVDAFVVRKRRFNKPELTWRISKYFNRVGLRRHILISVIRSALDAWSAAIPVDFRQITNNRDHADLDFRFLDSDIDDRCNNTFPYEQLAHCTHTNNPVGIHFNGNVRWAVGDVEYPTFDIFTVALHEIGHALGLAHSDDPLAVMHAAHSRTFENLADDDIQGVQSLYGRRRLADDTLDDQEHVESVVHASTSTSMSELRLGSTFTPLLVKSTSASELQLGSTVSSLLETSTPAPTLSTSSTFSTLSENGAYRSLCTPYRDYCGWQMQDLGYRVEQLARRNIYRCTLDKRGAFVKYCETECFLDPSLRPYCPCEEGDRLCGYLVQYFYISTPDSYYSEYQCVRSQAEGRMIWEEQQINETGTCTVDATFSVDAPCNESRMYCGYEMLHYGFVSSPNQSWQFYALYWCTDPYRPFKVCDGGCRYWEQLSGSFCIPSTTYIRTDFH